MATMRAIVIREAGGPEVLEEARRPIPEPGPGEIRVRVHAVGLNRADLIQRRGHYPAPPGVPADVPGLEYAGVVDATGAGAGRWSVGARVMGIVGGGAYAEYVVVHEDEALAVPSPLSLEEAAAVPEAYLTAHDALFTQLGLRRGERVLVHAVGSGVGTAALQLAHAAGAHVFGTSRSAWKLERATALGLELAIDTSREDFAEVVRERTDGHGVDVILDLVGAGFLAGNLRALATRGRMAVVGLVAGSRAELDLGLLLRKRITIVGTVMRSRSLEEKIQVARAFAETALPLFETGRLRPVLGETITPDDIRDAHRRMEENRTFGKIVMVWG